MSPTIEVNQLSYKFPDGSVGLENISLSLPAGSRTLLIGGTYSGHLAIQLPYIQEIRER